ncbi:ribosome-inactivating family protein [Spiroplasma endosymbiont of 'Nebria riversi']|uniref:ribosome-inactivating family protein n=1 Tax=Spiroplasma endosymbiont of 'Nebria riversi' TaxID=2792084 RepID=UPI001C04B057|nr:ribosome-inactivating family protein [Spiroplasma endosymbiont of 'Nebria riversi']
MLTSNAAGPLVANKSNNNKAKIKNSPKTLTRPKRQAPPKKGKNKKVKQPQNAQPSTSTADQVEFIEKEITLNENYAKEIKKMLQGLIDENYLDPLRSINMGGIISTELDNKTIISKLEELEPKMANWINEQQNKKEKILILTLKNSDDKNIKLVINLKNFYVLGFINNSNQYFHFKDSQVKEIKKQDLNIQESINLGYNSNYCHLNNDNFGISYSNIDDSISALSKHNIKDNNKIKQHLARLVFITSGAMRFQCDEKTLEIFAEIRNVDELKNDLKNILKVVQDTIDGKNEEINWADYKKQLNKWDKYSKQINEFRIEIWADLIKIKKLNDFIFNKKEDLINNLDNFLNFKNEQELTNKLATWFDKNATQDEKELKDDFVNEAKNFIKVQIKPLDLKILNNLSSNFASEQLIIKKQQEIFPEINQNFKTKNDVEKSDQEVKTEITNIINNISNNNTSLLCSSITQNNLDITKLLLMLNSNLEVINGYWGNLSPLHYGSYLGNIEIVKELLTNKNSKNKIKVNSMVEGDLSPLHYAAFFGHTEIIKLLLASGSNTNAKYVNNTPLNIATNNGHIEAQNLLKKFNELNQKIIKDKELLKNLSEKLTPEQKQELEKRIKERIKNTKKELKTLLQPTYDVPADNSCLFWSVSTSYLLPVRNNNEEFRNRFIQLFGEENLKYLLHIQKLLQQYDLEDNRNLNQLWYQDATAHTLVRIVFRNRVVDYIQSNLDTIPNRNGELTFRNLIQDNNDIDTNYLEIMQQPSTWGGHQK